MTPNFLLITNMSYNSRGREKTQIALIKCVRGGQGTKKTRKKLPGNWMVDLEGEVRGPTPSKSISIYDTKLFVDY